jgi:undecaprenyl-diphosphatase
MHRIIDFDKQLFLEINRHHQEWLDPVMLFFSSYTAWGIIAFFLLSYVFYVQGKSGGGKPLVSQYCASLPLIFLINLIKIIIARPRPIHEQAFVDLIHAIEKFDASYSFFSAHSSSSFALAVFISLVIRKNAFSLLRFILGILSRLQRIYVGKHYPFDVVAGIIFGTLMAFIGWKLFDDYKNKKMNSK